MNLKDRLQSDLQAAIKGREELRAATLRMALTAVTMQEVAGPQARTLSDQEIVTVLTREEKKRREAAEAFDRGDRPERAERERAESEVLAEYLPAPLSDPELRDLVAQAVEQSGAGASGQGQRAMGQVMKVVQPLAAGRVDGGRLAAEVRRQLGS